MTMPNADRDARWMKASHKKERGSPGQNGLFAPPGPSMPSYARRNPSNRMECILPDGRFYGAGRAQERASTCRNALALKKQISHHEKRWRQ